MGHLRWSRIERRLRSAGCSRDDRRRRRAIIKIGVPGPTGFEQEARALPARQRSRLREVVAARRRASRHAAGTNSAPHSRSWTCRYAIRSKRSARRCGKPGSTVPDDLPLMNGSEKARSLAKLISSAWQQLERPCSERAVECALGFADARHARIRCSGFCARPRRRAQSEHAVDSRRRSGRFLGVPFRRP